jgi:cbb3-type cytochrome oxidase maturation protein
MEVIYVLIPGMIFFGLLTVGVLIWAVKKNQYDDLEGDASRILMDDDEELMPNPHPAQHADQPGDQGGGEQRASGTRRDRRHWPDHDERGD